MDKKQHISILSIVIFIVSEVSIFVYIQVICIPVFTSCS